MQAIVLTYNFSGRLDLIRPSLTVARSFAGFAGAPFRVPALRNQKASTTSVPMVKAPLSLPSLNGLAPFSEVS
jgi:hypothetical protein